LQQREATKRGMQSNVMDITIDINCPKLTLNKDKDCFNCKSS